MKASKYLNKKTVVDGIPFDSKKEAARYSDLRLLERTGRISNLKIQPEFVIVPAVKWNGLKLRARKYKADFMYEQLGRVIVEDVKSAITKKNPVYTLKRQLFLLKYGDQYTFLET